MCIGLLAFLSPEWVTAVFTGVLTLATIAYVIFTLLLWRATNKSAAAAAVAAEAAKSTAEATRVAAEAAKKSADMAMELNRPAIAIVRMEAINWPQNLSALVGQRDVHLVLRNYGNLYATKLGLTWQAHLAGSLQSTSQPNSPVFDIAPGPEYSFRFSVNVPGGARVAGQYRIVIRAEYRAPGRCFRYAAARVLNAHLEFEPEQDNPDRDEIVPC